MEQFLFLCIVVTASGISSHHVHLPQSQKDKLHQYTMQCVKQSGVKPEVIREAKKGNLSDDEALKEFTLCFFQKSGIISQDGKLDVDAALMKLPSCVDTVEVKKVLDDGDTTADKAFEIFKCYYKKTPTHIMF